MILSTMVLLAFSQACRPVESSNVGVDVGPGVDLGDGGGGTTTGDDTGDTSTVDTADTGSTTAYVGTGTAEGDVAWNLAAMDQEDKLWRLWEHDGGPVVLAMGYGQSWTWQSICGFLPAVHERYAEDPVTVAAVLTLDPRGGPVDRADLESWQATYPIPWVLRDAFSEIVGTWVGEVQVQTYVVDGEMVIRRVFYESVTEAQIEDAVDEILGR